MQNRLESYFCVSCGVMISVFNSTELTIIPVLCARCRIGKETTYLEESFQGFCNACGCEAHVTAFKERVYITCKLQGTRTVYNTGPWPHGKRESYLGKEN